MPQFLFIIIRTDEFQVECPVLGTLQSLLVRHDNSGSSPGWYLDKIIVDDTDSNRVYVFPCDRWLAKNEDDGKIALELFCGSAEKSSGEICFVICTFY